MSKMLSSIARGTEGVALVKFANLHGLADDWHDAGQPPPGASPISVMVSGSRLDNIFGNLVMVDEGEISPEYLIHLGGNRAKCVVNLATVLAMATAYARQQIALAGGSRVKKDAPIQGLQLPGGTVVRMTPGLLDAPPPNGHRPATPAPVVVKKPAKKPAKKATVRKGRTSARTTRPARRSGSR
jgi:hypothetical protein